MAATGKTTLEYDAEIASMSRQVIDDELSFEAFFANAEVNPKGALVKGVICGYRVEATETPLTRQVRILDKLLGELARGRPIEKTLRTG